MQDYKLFHGDAIEVLRTLDDNSIDTCITDPPYGLEFMNKGWDSVVPGVQYWSEILRVVKPGGFLLAFGGTRTFHRLMVFIEDSGWIIRDCMMWLHSRGFPKSHDIGKAIDKDAGAKREVVGTVRKLASAAKVHDGWKRPWAFDENGEPKRTMDITIPSTNLAKEWDGWGTALKPAWEPIVVAMKPLEGTFVQNAKLHGVAGIWIDGIRIGDNPGYKYNADKNGTIFHGEQGQRIQQTAQKKGTQYIESKKGRWPTNAIVGHTPECTSTCTPECPANTLALTYGQDKLRYYYCPKAPQKEKWVYCSICENAYPISELDNHLHDQPNTKHIIQHPTQKPLELLQYLVRMTKTPTNGTVLDPFMGSGTTGVASVLEHRPFVGIDNDIVSCITAARRLETLPPQLTMDL